MVATKIAIACVLPVALSGIASVLASPAANYDAYLKEVAELRARGKLHPRASPAPGTPPPTSSGETIAFPADLPHWGKSFAGRYE